MRTPEISEYLGNGKKTHESGSARGSAVEADDLQIDARCYLDVFRQQVGHSADSGNSNGEFSRFAFRRGKQLFPALIGGILVYDDCLRSRVEPADGIEIVNGNLGYAEIIRAVINYRSETCGRQGM